MPSLAHSVPRPLKRPSLARSVPKPRFRFRESLKDHAHKHKGWLSDLAALIGGGDSPQFPSDFYGFAYPGIEDYKSTDRCWHN